MQTSVPKTPMQVVGPYSVWPRRRMSTRTKVIGGGMAAAVATFVHCIVPMM